MASLVLTGLALKDGVHDGSRQGGCRERSAFESRRVVRAYRHLDSGLAEEGAVFSMSCPGEADTVWIVT